MARVLIVGGGCRGRALAGALVAEGHAVRVSTRTEAGREPIEAVGAECWIGDPDVVGSLRYALDQVTVLCWLLATATGPPDRVQGLHGSRLDMMLRTAVDTTVRGVVYEARGSVAAADLDGGARLVARTAGARGLPFAILEADPADPADSAAVTAWGRAARAAIIGLLESRRAARVD